MPEDYYLRFVSDSAGEEFTDVEAAEAYVRELERRNKNRVQ